MHAASANVSGQIASVLAGGVLLDLCLRTGDVQGTSAGIGILLVGMGRVLLGLAMVGLCIHLLKGILRIRGQR
jgi:hypothetical protein